MGLQLSCYLNLDKRESYGVATGHVSLYPAQTGGYSKNFKPVHIGPHARSRPSVASWTSGTTTACLALQQPC